MWVSGIPLVSCVTCNKWNAIFYQIKKDVLIIDVQPSSSLFLDKKKIAYSLQIYHRIENILYLLFLNWFFLLVAPKVTIQPEVALMIGMDMVLKCDVQGNPPPIVTWSKGTRKLPTGRQMHNKYSFTYTLKLIDMNAVHLGKYNCSATNILGSDFGITSVKGRYMNFSWKLNKCFKKPIRKRNNYSILYHIMHCILLFLKSGKW